VHRERDVKVFERIPERFVKVVVEAMFPTGTGLTCTALKPKSFTQRRASRAASSASRRSTEAAPNTRPLVCEQKSPSQLL